MNALKLHFISMSLFFAIQYTVGYLITNDKTYLAKFVAPSLAQTAHETMGFILFLWGILLIVARFFKNKAGIRNVAAKAFPQTHQQKHFVFMIIALFLLWLSRSPYSGGLRSSIGFHAETYASIHKYASLAIVLNGSVLLLGRLLTGGLETTTEAEEKKDK